MGRVRLVLSVAVVVLFVGWCLALIVPEYVGAWR